MFRYGIWGPVRDLTDNDAAVICRELGFSRGIAIVGHVFRPPTESRIVALGGRCAGTEQNFLNCTAVTSVGWDFDDSQSSGMAVACTSGSAAPLFSDIELKISQTSSDAGVVNGTLAWLHQGTWRSLVFPPYSDNYATIWTADYLCTRLGYLAGRAGPDATGDGVIYPGYWAASNATRERSIYPHTGMSPGATGTSLTCGTEVRGGKRPSHGRALAYFQKIM